MCQFNIQGDEDLEKVSAPSFWHMVTEIILILTVISGFV